MVLWLRNEYIMAWFIGTVIVLLSAYCTWVFCRSAAPETVEEQRLEDEYQSRTLSKLYDSEA